MPRQALIDLTEALIKHPSDQTNQAARSAVLEEIITYIKVHAPNVTIQHHSFPCPRTGQSIESIHVFNNKHTGQPIILSGHLDVVAAASKMYTPSHDDTYIYGRGAADMKGGVAIAILAFIQNHATCNVQLLLTNDEEIGSAGGAEKLAPLLDPALVIVFEASGLGICHKRKGGIWIDVEVTSPGGHGARPWWAPNAIDVLMQFTRAVQQAYPNPTEDCWQSTMNMGAIHGGDLQVKEGEISIKSGNIIAPNAWARMDFRLTEEHTPESVLTQLKTIAASISPAITLHPGARLLRLLTPKDNPKVQALAAAFEQVTHKPAEFIVGHGASDTRFFKNAVDFGPIGFDYHGHNERVDITSMVTCLQVVNKFLTNEKI